MEKGKTVFEINRAVDRRSFLKLSGLLGLGVASAGIIPLTAEAVKFNRDLYKVSKTRLAIGTFVSMTLLHPSRDEAEEAMAGAFEEVNRLNGLMSRFESTTAVAQLNREGFLKGVPPEVAQVVARALDYYRLTRGCFDISVKPVVDLFMESFESAKPSEPTETQITQVLERVGADKIKLDGRTVTFGKPGMGITLDGIAKGYIVDRASEVLSKHGIKNHLINAGGDIRTVWSPSDRKPWTIAIEDPSKHEHFPDVIQLTNGAIATSGNYEVYFDREKMFFHIVDPATGRSPQLSTSVSVTAAKAIDADALSTSVFVMNPVRGTRFIDSLPHCECFVLGKTGDVFKSAGWKSAAI